MQYLFFWMVKNDSSDDFVPSSQWFIRVGERWKNENACLLPQFPLVDQSLVFYVARKFVNVPLDVGCSTHFIFELYFNARVLCIGDFWSHLDCVQHILLCRPKYKRSCCYFVHDFLTSVYFQKLFLLLICIFALFWKDNDEDHIYVHIMAFF